MKPLVSCICVTRDRRDFLKTAIKSFVSQDWPEKELIVIDDGKDQVKDLCSEVKGCSYFYLSDPEKIGPKRNIACQKAAGTIIAHWDDDDWSAPERLREQVRNLWQSQKSVTGYNTMLFWDAANAEGFRYKGMPNYSLGTALCYRKEFWSRHQFISEDHRNLEDNKFVTCARDENQIAAFDGARTMVARIHAGNTSPKKPHSSPQQWLPMAQDEFPEEFFKAIRMKLNLGCCDRHFPGFVGVDIAPPADVIADLNDRWPWEDSSVAEIRAWDLIEHLRSPIQTMNEAFRVLRPGGRFDIIVPTTDGRGAWQDPGHVSLWNRNSFFYYQHGNPHLTRFAPANGVRCAFRIVHEVEEMLPDHVSKLHIVLEAVK